MATAKWKYVELEEPSIRAEAVTVLAGIFVGGSVRGRGQVMFNGDEEGKATWKRARNKNASFENMPK